MTDPATREKTLHTVVRDGFALGCKACFTGAADGHATGCPEWVRAQLPSLLDRVDRHGIEAMRQAFSYRRDLTRRVIETDGNNVDRSRLRAMRSAYHQGVKLIDELLVTGGIRHASVGGSDGILDALSGAIPEIYDIVENCEGAVASVINGFDGGDPS